MAGISAFSAWTFAGSLRAGFLMDADFGFVTDPAPFLLAAEAAVFVAPGFEPDFAFAARVRAALFLAGAFS
jgi:hypothetical protein